MIKKIALASSALMICASTIMAEEHHHAKSGEFYVVVKGLYTTGETIKEGTDITLDGKAGRGLGIDVGYTLPYHFAVELDTSYSKNDVTEDDGVDIVNGVAKYWTYAADVTYTYPLTHSIGIMGKLGYEFEHEKIDELNVDLNDNGMVYGAGVEYHINEHYEALVEYEGSTIDSVRGSSVYAGIKYIF
ncbi:porin family protein [Sulfurimonas microaerophilic]|uniref:porin family protein n=1 Tax=Sulfurimonas microaerophilic TaxID=3058392 RepID=UPI0027147ABC|nr:porin family protein [Sulfurimonas sp. hsl 1-7]